MDAAKLPRERKNLWIRTLLGCGLAAVLSIGFSQMSCAVVEPGWFDDPPDMRGDGPEEVPDGPPEQCFPGTATSEYQLLNRCTDAERIERPSHIPTSTWDGKGPLPQP